MKKNSKLVCSPAYARFCFLLVLSLLFSAFTQAQTVTGTVTDAANQPVSGATVTVKGTAKATTTDNGEKFSINAASNDVLIVTSVGYLTKEVPVDGKTSINTSLVTDAQNLNEVVVTALAITRQARALGYSTTTVKPEDLTVNRSPNLINALEGKIAGV